MYMCLCVLYDKRVKTVAKKNALSNLLRNRLNWNSKRNK